MPLFKRFCIIIPPSPWLISDTVEVPLGVLWLAKAAQYVADVRILDLSGGVYTDYVLPEADLYGVSFVTPQTPYAIEILQRIKRETGKPVVCGGAHPTALPAECLRYGFDAVVCGEGETHICNIITHGVNRQIYSLQYEELIDDIPAWDLIDIDKYLADVGVVKYLGEAREINIMATRGCPGKCAYCTRYKGPLRWRSLQSIVDEIQLLQKKGTNRFFFVDDNLIVSRRRLYELCGVLKGMGISWHCLGRADMLDNGRASVMAQSGCTGIDFGIETGSDRLLKIIKKGTNAATQERGIRAASDAGLKVRAQMMVGLPQETEQDIDETVSFINRNYQDVAKWGIHIFCPFPSCDIYTNPSAYGYPEPTQDWSKYQTCGKPGENGYTPPRDAEIIFARKRRLQHTVGERDIVK